MWGDGYIRSGLGWYCSCLMRDREGVDVGAETRLSCLTLGTDRLAVGSFLMGAFFGAGSFLTLATFCGVATGLETVLPARLRLVGAGFLGVLLLACCASIYWLSDAPPKAKLTTR